MKSIETIIRNLRVAMTDARQNESHFESWMILNEAICDAIDALAEQPAQQCNHCNGSGRMVRDPDIGTDQECFVCEGVGFIKPEQPAQQQEPVAWRWVPSKVFPDYVISDDPEKARSAASHGMNIEPLYTSPQPSKPLTPLLFSRRKAIADKLGVPMDATFNAIVRKVEAAHGITIEAAHGIKGDA